jgi:hypothetical protein
VDTDRVDATKLLPCAVEKTSADKSAFCTIARFVVRLLAVKLDTPISTLFTVEPVMVDAVTTIAVTVLPPSVDTYALLPPIVETVMLDVTIVLPPIVE